MSVVKVVCSGSVTLHTQIVACDSVPMVPFNTRLVHIHMSVVKVVYSGSVTLHTQIVACDSVPTRSPKAHAAVTARMEGYPGGVR
jgi:ABC-type molybdate transport system substrate-binding protein